MKLVLFVMWPCHSPKVFKFKLETSGEEEGISLIAYNKLKTHLRSAGT